MLYTITVCFWLSFTAFFLNTSDKWFLAKPPVCIWWRTIFWIHMLSQQPKCCWFKSPHLIFICHRTSYVVLGKILYPFCVTPAGCDCYRFSPVFVYICQWSIGNEWSENYLYVVQRNDQRCLLIKWYHRIEHQLTLLFLVLHYYQ